ncbi:uncharacterized protein LACBIDRAFT_303767 [Laccaria bicolor S238N-H82]|uniref:Predicted protein n=1 Tax=Laccaria bicolor (strain S238N-H82 / ATCC MYA-4686) TaxID=486041 RepID=B0DK95_LACBS|nr:uncharacterized protein LACBIDRAFT_303767 [Laccaria bicolor S238N-H82]EDR04903.1 predicted protein [Laccaria bicolor S238N-H82]|eukprot:XP_001884293.1 predicted protein [Laccaria bicolor S238N-H82]
MLYNRSQFTPPSLRRVPTQFQPLYQFNNIHQSTTYGLLGPCDPPSSLNSFPLPRGDPNIYTPISVTHSFI